MRGIGGGELLLLSTNESDQYLGRSEAKGDLQHGVLQVLKMLLVFGW